MPALTVKLPYTVDATGNRESVSASRPCRWVTVRQDPSETPVEYFVSDVPSGGNKLRKYPAEFHTFTNATGLFQAGEIVGYVEAASGSFTMQQEEVT